MSPSAYCWRKSSWGGGDAESRKPALARLTMLKTLLLHPEMLRDKAVSGPVVDPAIPFFPERRTAPRALAHLGQGHAH